MNPHPAAAAPPLHPILILATAMLATAMVAIDMTIAGVALPHMQGSFSVTQDQIAWVMTSYIAATAVVMPCTGWAGARFGRKRLFFVSLAAFTVASVLCGAARTLEAEVLFRVLQGIFGAPMVPLAQSVILDTFPREQHGKALGIWGLGLMLGPIMGPTLGGYLTEEYGWPYIYYINVPLGILACIGAWTVIPRTARNPRAALDWFGFAMLSLGVVALQLMLDRGERLDWFDSEEIVIEAFVAALGLYLFSVHVLTGRETFLNRALLRDRNFATGMALVFIFGFVLLPPLLLLPPFLQNLRDYPVTYTGVLLSLRGLGVMIGMQIGGRLVNRGDPRFVILAGIVAFVAGGWPMARWTLEVGSWDIIWTGALQGLGLGLVYVPLLAVSFSTLPTQHRTEGTGFFNLMRNIGSSISVAVFAGLLIRNTSINHAVLAEHISPYRAAAHSLAGHLQSFDSARALAMVDAEVTRQAAMIAYANDFYLVVLAALVAVPLVFLLRPATDRPAHRRPATETSTPAPQHSGRT